MSNININDLWEEMAKSLNKHARDCGHISTKASFQSETQWWDEDIQAVIREKGKLKVWQKAKDDETMRSCDQAKTQTLEDLYNKLQTKEGEKDIYLLERTQEREIKCTEEVRNWKDEGNKIFRAWKIKAQVEKLLWETQEQRESKASTLESLGKSSLGWINGRCH